ncbi:MAG: VIT1/CCC1 transporter family protein [Chloroflexi bacterium]|uniref:VIT1/CCC1 transporter family protein n=1 Tax=Candidatus Chlorohelix allophototropha TaxID=3003348 RepID=A0A8T7LWL7_9CHLR|nr:VIT1/CCC1 transporter family protein [Chloroflexota bacterium]WJW66491.1 VIT1/CCC1 transporter family protein [Chloroflexota bacterium L227-S17]
MATNIRVKQYRENWQSEMDNVTLYRALSDIEKQPQLKEVYKRMADVEEVHAKLWESKLKEFNPVFPAHNPGWRARALIWLAQKFGTQFVLPTIANREQVDSHAYDKQPEAQAANLPRDEQTHALLLRTITGASPEGMVGSQVAQLEGRHRGSGGNALRAAVLGSNDGLVSNLSLVMGVAGADLAGHTILITGIAGLLAGACSMALGEWLSVQSARELYERQISIEKQELTEAPEVETEELALIYQAKGLPKEEAQALAQKLIGDNSTALDTLSREELGIDPDELGGSAWVAAGTSFLLFALGAIIPVLPYFFVSGLMGAAISGALSAVALFLIGAGITLLTGRNTLYSGFRQVLFGLLAAGVTFGVGKLIGVALAG